MHSNLCQCKVGNFAFHQFVRQMCIYGGYLQPWLHAILHASARCVALTETLSRSVALQLRQHNVEAAHALPSSSHCTTFFHCMHLQGLALTPVLTGLLTSSRPCSLVHKWHVAVEGSSVSVWCSLHSFPALLQHTAVCHSIVWIYLEWFYSHSWEYRCCWPFVRASSYT